MVLVSLVVVRSVLTPVEKLCWVYVVQFQQLAESLLVAAFSWDLVDLQESECRFSVEFLAISVNCCL